MVTVVPDGPLYLRGDIEITNPDGEMVLEDTRVALCRCGASQNKPLYDDSHVDIDFQADGRIGDDHSQADDDPVNDVLRVQTRPGGPITLDWGIRDSGHQPQIQCSRYRDGALPVWWIGEQALLRWGAHENRLPRRRLTSFRIGEVMGRVSGR